LIDEQLNDVASVECRKKPEVNDGNYVLRDGVLFHVDSVVSQRVEQLLAYRGLDVRTSLTSAHDNYGLHQGQTKTNERIRYSFFWPGLEPDVIKYCKSCLPSQQTKRLRVEDRVPINAISRNNLVSGQHVMMDVIGPINHPSSSGQKYLICIVDMCTRWPAVYLLKNLTVRSLRDS
jgi:hypothetical protein